MLPKGAGFVNWTGTQQRNCFRCLHLLSCPVFLVVAQDWTRERTDFGAVFQQLVNHFVALPSCWSNELSRNRTYIGNLEGFCPDPLDDEPVFVCKEHECATKRELRG